MNYNNGMRSTKTHGRNWHFLSLSDNDCGNRIISSGLTVKRRRIFFTNAHFQANHHPLEETMPGRFWGRKAFIFIGKYQMKSSYLNLVLRSMTQRFSAVKTKRSYETDTPWSNAWSPYTFRLFSSGSCQFFLLLRRISGLLACNSTTKEASCGESALHCGQNSENFVLKTPLEICLVGWSRRLGGTLSWRYRYSEQLLGWAKFDN